MRKERFVKIFVTGSNLEDLENQINDYIKQKSVDIIDVSYDCDSIFGRATAIAIFER